MREIQAQAFARSVFVQDNWRKFTGHVLDVGCGAMPYKRLFSDDTGDFRPDCDVTAWTGLDIRGVGDVQADAHELPYEDESFDTVLCTEVLQYVGNPFLVVGECARVVKPGGYVVISAQNVHPDDGFAMFGIKSAGLGAMYQAAGLVDIQIGKSGGAISGDFDDFRYATKYALNVPTDIEGFIGGLADKYPMLTLGTAKKEQANVPQGTAQEHGQDSGDAGDGAGDG